MTGGWEAARMRVERPFFQERCKREVVICPRLSDALDRWRICHDPKIKEHSGSILLFSYVQSGLGNRETMGLAFNSAGDCEGFIDMIAMMAIEGRV